MKQIAIFGMGYVGCVTLGAFSQLGHKLIGVEVDQKKIDMLNNGIPPVNEPGLNDLIKEGIKSSNISFKSELNGSLFNVSIAIICVGTPPDDSGNANLEYVNKCIQQIIKEKSFSKSNNDFTIAIRSTVPPDYIEKHLNEFLKINRVTIPNYFNIVANPEFLREGSALSDFLNPPFNILGKMNPNTNVDNYLSLFSNIQTETIITKFSSAFLIKYSCNLFHSIKATFANEIGIFADAFDIDANEVLDIFTKDEHLNISKKYLKYGYAIGGSCLPKDQKAFVSMANSKHISVPMIKSIYDSNENLINHTVDRLLKTNKQCFGFYGITFKQYTDDLRESPFVKTINLLIENKKQIYILEDDIIVKNLNGLNKIIYDELNNSKSINFINKPFQIFEKSEIFINTKENIEKIKYLLQDCKIKVLDLSVGQKLYTSYPAISKL